MRTRRWLLLGLVVFASGCINRYELVLQEVDTFCELAPSTAEYDRCIMGYGCRKGMSEKKCGELMSRKMSPEEIEKITRSKSNRSSWKFCRRNPSQCAYSRRFLNK